MVGGAGGLTGFMSQESLPPINDADTSSRINLGSSKVVKVKTNAATDN